MIKLARHLSKKPGAVQGQATRMGAEHQMFCLVTAGGPLRDYHGGHDAGSALRPAV